MTITNPSITDLAAMVDSLPADEKRLFQQIYAVTTAIGELRTTPSMQPWVKRQFGSVAAVTRQKIVKVTNVVTNEGTLFNRLRDLRPIETIEEKSLDTLLLGAIQKDTFRYPEEDTPEDLFGRIAGKHCITASNIAKYDGLHGVVIFNEFNPLQFSKEQVIDYIDVGWKWAKRAQATHPQAKYFLFVWNCLFRAGASIVHGHAQMMLAEGRHYAKIEGLRQAALSYQQNYGSNYFTDTFRVHHSVGCAMDKGGVKILASLTPFRNNEVILIADELDLSFKERIYEVLACFRDELGVVSFNLGFIMPPLAETDESWEGFPVMVGVVDRGNPNSRASDVGGVEIYAASVVSSDPFELARQLKQYFD
jgi:hypothetical protein